MIELPNFPMLSQLGDGDINDQLDCVPTSIAAGLEYLTGKKYTGGQVKDAVYGKPYQGPTAIDHYIEYCGQQEVHLLAKAGTGQALTDAIIANLKKGFPCLGTEPDPYVEPSRGWTHVIIFYGYDENKNTLTAMDPYIAKPVTRSITDWSSILQFGAVWAMEGNEMSGIPKGWSDDGKVLRAPGTNIVVTLGFRDWILSHYWNPDDIPLENEMHCDQLEIGNPDLGAGQRQRFRMTTLEYTPKMGVFQGWINQEIIVLETRLCAIAYAVQPFIGGKK